MLLYLTCSDPFLYQDLVSDHWKPSYRMEAGVITDYYTDLATH